MTVNNLPPIVVGWREWVSLPELALPAIKAKIDTGAKTSALHAFYTETYEDRGTEMVKFGIHPIQGNSDIVINCRAPVIDYREVSDSGGHREMRHVIETLLVIGEHRWRIEMTLTNRDTMRFRMLLGRRALEENIIVKPGASYINGKLYPRELYKEITESHP